MDFFYCPKCEKSHSPVHESASRLELAERVCRESELVLYDIVISLGTRKDDMISLPFLKHIEQLDKALKEWRNIYAND